MQSIPRRDFIRLGSQAAILMIMPSSLKQFSKNNKMTSNETFDVIIVGGSYAGLAAAMALGRAMKNVLIIDNGKPCNRQTPHSHNFLTNDGKKPAEIAAIASLQVSRYDTVKFFTGTAIEGNKTGAGFQIKIATGESFEGLKIIFATGIKDLLPAIEGLSECWGISVIHCPYCHGYEVRHEKTGILGNGDTGFEFTGLISNWTKDLTLFSNGKAYLTSIQREKLQHNNVSIDEREIQRLIHNNGHLEEIIFKDGSSSSIKALYAPSPFEQHCKIPQQMGCGLTEEGYIAIDPFYETSVKGIFAVGDNAAKMRTVANAVAMGTSAGIMISKKMIIDSF